MEPKFAIIPGGKGGQTVTPAAEERISGSGGGTGGPMEPDLGPRVDALERRCERIEGKLDLMLTKLDELPTHRELYDLSLSVGGMKATLNNVPTRKEHGELQAAVARIDGRISSLPTWLNIMTLLTIAIGLSAGLGNLDRIVRAFREPAPVTAPALPPAPQPPK